MTLYRARLNVVSDRLVQLVLILLLGCGGRKPESVPPPTTSSSSSESALSLEPCPPGQYSCREDIVYSKTLRRQERSLAERVLRVVVNEIDAESDPGVCPGDGRLGDGILVVPASLADTLCQRVRHRCLGAQAPVGRGDPETPILELEVGPSARLPTGWGVLLTCDLTNRGGSFRMGRALFVTEGENGFVLKHFSPDTNWVRGGAP